MSGETVITVCGNLVDDPHLSFTPGGAAVAKFRVASTPRVFDKQANEWRDGEGLFLSCSVWRQQAEHAAETLQRGMRVIVQGQLKQRSYEKDGQKRMVYEVDVHEVGPSLKSATAKVTRVSSGQGQQAYREARQQQGQRSAEDPWSSNAPGVQRPAGDGWGQEGGGYSDEPPF
ncbi:MULTISPECIES: single-stranded DNA-binding protein [unclassified Streptomyces]|uniref:single-stranded DNA-binding protein n=1 Tax=unclassified Streptomyces TaxID=2593676 RepID=UPI000805F331|nr:MULTISPECIES: single-stranded DNA-binding protein [unclassified Streptomyces]MYR75115.1 single-stranded DNA-binding protein [Streptomyces sp. SID4925]SBU97965.1 single-strand DNA-binding protein [Streptomyces sp. OspMP-M45]